MKIAKTSITATPDPVNLIDTVAPADKPAKTQIK